MYSEPVTSNLKDRGANPFLFVTKGINVGGCGRAGLKNLNKTISGVSA
jgi:hypothetical protein